MTLRKPLIIATLAAAVALGTVSQRAEAADPLLGALIGGGIGAAIGHDINHHGGGVVGGFVGALIGSSIAAESNREYYGEPGYAPAPAYAPAPVYAPAPAYGYAPPPVYVAPAYRTVVYRTAPRYEYHRQWRDHGYEHRHG
jgi:hypothetical protein